MKTRETIPFNSDWINVNPLVWALFVVYIVLSLVVTQLFNLEASRLSGIILITPIILMLLITLMMTKGKIRIVFSYYHRYILLFGFFCLASSFWAEAPELAISKGMDILEIFVIMMIISICFQKVDSIDPFLMAIMCGYYIVIFYEIVFFGWDYFVFVMRNSARVTSEFINANTLGMSASFAIIINLYFVFSKKMKAWTLALVVLAIAVIAATGSRKALISLLFGIFLYFMIRSLRKDRGTLPLVRFVISLPIIGFIAYQVLRLPMFSGIMQRVEGIINIFTGGVVDKSAMIRISLVQLGLRLFKQHPILGIGIDNPRLYTYGVVGETYYLHNNYIEILSSGGIIGFALYYSIYIKILISYIKKRKFDDSQYCICFVLLVSNLVLDYGMVSYYSKSTFIFLLLFAKLEELLSQDPNWRKERCQ